jgi:hypothetical protein
MVNKISILFIMNIKNAIITIFIYVISLILQTLFIPCLCKIGSIFTQFILVVDIIFFVIIIAYIFKKMYTIIFYLSIIFIFSTIIIISIKMIIHQ